MSTPAHPCRHRLRPFSFAPSTPQIGNIYRKRLEEDGVDPAMWRKAGSESSVAPHDAPAASDVAAPAPLAQRSAGVSVSVPGDAGNGSRSAAKPAALVPKGAYRRVMCVPADLEWMEAPRWAKDDERSGSSCAAAGGSSQGTAVCDAVSGGHHSEGVGGEEVAFAGTGGEGGGENGAVAGGSTVEDVCLSFALPPGSFATMLLREVMKTNDDVGWGGGRGEGEEQDGGVLE